MQASRVSAAALTEVLADFFTRMTKVCEARRFVLAAGLDLSFSQLCILFLLDTGDHEPALHELAEQLGLSVAAAGRAVDGLVRAGIVARREDEHDRRVKRVSLTEPGRALLLRLADAHNEGLRTFVDLLSERERRALHDALAPILARAELLTHKEKESR